MSKILNIIFYILKFILYLVSLGLTFFIILSMYNRVGKTFIDLIPIFLPFLLLILICIINIIFSQKSVINNIFYNLTSCLALATICFVSYRAIFDKGMVLNKIMGYNIDFTYFSDFIPFMKIMIYGLVIGNIFFMYKEKKNKDIKPIAKKIEIEVI